MKDGYFDVSNFISEEAGIPSWRFMQTPKSLSRQGLSYINEKSKKERELKDQGLSGDSDYTYKDKFKKEAKFKLGIYTPLSSFKEGHHPVDVVISANHVPQVLGANVSISNNPSLEYASTPFSEYSKSYDDYIQEKKNIERIEKEMEVQRNKKQKDKDQQVSNPYLASNK